MSRYSRVIGTGGLLRETVLTNKDIEDIIDTSDDWIRGRTVLMEGFGAGFTWGTVLLKY